MDQKMEVLLSLLDRRRLIKIANLLPSGNEFTLYRGVANMNDMKAVRRWSWTSDLQIAKWFARDSATQQGTSNPAVYSLQVKRQNILFYTNDYSENEFFVRLRKTDNPIVVCDKIPRRIKHPSDIIREQNRRKANKPEFMPNGVEGEMPT